jgi:hypothetical protein
MIKLFIALFVSLSVASCSTNWGNVRKSVVECGSKLVEGQLPGLFNKVKEVLEGGSPDWSSQLDSLGIKDGIGLVVCAVTKYVQLNSTPTTSTAAGTKSKVSALTVSDLSKTQAVLKAVSYLSKHK